jgi:flagellar M-ring protein FliF
VFKNLFDWFKGLTLIARTGLIAGVCAVIVLFVMLSSWALSTDYQVLFSELDPQDASAIVTELERMKIPYQLDDGGKSISIEQSQVYKTRLKLMSKGVNLRGTVGFEIFNESDFGMTDFAQRINYQRALQGEIARTIMGLEEVQSARVHIVMPEASFLKKSEKQTKASITITTKEGRKLSADQVLGIQRLVAASIPEIETHAVTILDSRGVALTSAAGTDQDDNKSLEGRLALKQQTEDYFSKKVASVLDKTFGSGKAIVSVDVTINHDSSRMTREDVVPASSTGGDPEGAVSRKKKTSRVSGKTKEQTKKQGTTQTIEGSSGEGEYLTSVDQVTEEVEYLHGKQLEQIVSTPGAIKRLSVGVVLPNNVSPEQIVKLSKVISMSVGLDTDRGDALAIYPLDQYMSQETVGQDVDSKTPKVAGLIASTTKTRTQSSNNSSLVSKELTFNTLIAIALCLVAALILLWIAIRRRAHKTERMTEEERVRMLNEIQSWIGQGT